MEVWVTLSIFDSKLSQQLRHPAAATASPSSLAIMRSNVYISSGLPRTSERLLRWLADIEKDFLVL